MNAEDTYIRMFQAAEARCETLLREEERLREHIRRAPCSCLRLDEGKTCDRQTWDRIGCWKVAALALGAPLKS